MSDTETTETTPTTNPPSNRPATAPSGVGSTDTSPYLEGPFAPVAEEVTATELRVTGTIPPELAGRLLRIGPNPVTPPDPATYHWFTGSGMVHGVHLRDGRADWYRNRWVRDPQVSQALGEERIPGSAGLMETTVNTHVFGFAGRTLASVESGSRPIELSDTLDSLGYCDFDGTLDGAFAAHTKLDPVTGELHAVTYNWSWDHIRHVVVGPDWKVRRELQVPVADGPMVHDCAISERYVVLFDLPVTFSLEQAGQGGFPYLWNDAHPARVGLLPRAADATADNVRWFDVDPCYVFHPYNAFDVVGDGGDVDAVVVDLIRWDRVFDRNPLAPDETQPVPERWTLDLTTGRARLERLDDQGQEFPRLDERRLGQPYRYGYTTVVPDERDAFAMAGTVKRDFERGTAEVHDHGPGRSALEPVFVPRDATATSPGSEDDGWVMAYVHDAAEDRTDVVILAADDLTADPVATVHLPVRVPFGFHGSWLPDA
jgi:carotenoid cleavage dioxygenase-like enzyme